MPERDRPVCEGPGLVGIAGDDARHPVRLGNGALESTETLRERFVDEVGPVDVEHVEEPHVEVGVTVSVGFVAGEPAHRLLEGSGTVLSERGAVHLAVEDDPFHR